MSRPSARIDFIVRCAWMEIPVVATVNGVRSAHELTGVHPSRARAALRELLERPALHVRDLTMPVLVVVDDGVADDGLPGVVTPAQLEAAISRWYGLGIRGVKLFVQGHDRDDRASGALAPGNRMVSAIEQIKAAVPGMVVTTEVCGCSWTLSGECALLDAAGRIDLAATYELMATMALAHARSGADIVSPTAMLAGSVRAVRLALDREGLPDVGVNPNIAIHTSLYTRFKELMGTNPGRGHRRGLQLEPGRADRDALLQADQWLAEGADALTLQPVMAAVDVLVRLRDHVRVPLVAYSTSGEYQALTALGTPGMLEYHAGLKRAGADLLLTFAAVELAETLAGGRHG
jgi:porphobilinogen synthase